MRRQSASITLLICGALFMAVGIGTWSMPSVVSAMPARQDPLPPPARPPVDPIPPDGGSRGNDEDGGGGGSKAIPTPLPAGRITGTVIDQSTGAPVAGVEVIVGGVVVRTNADGNYERTGLLPGTYTVNLSLSPGQGTALQAPQTVVLEQNGTAVVHLYYAPVQPTATPVPPTSVPFATPTPVPAAGASPPAPSIPGQLPVTSIEAPAGATTNTQVTAPELRPAKLPITADSNQARMAWLWLMLGTALLIAGGLLQLTTRSGRSLVLASATQRGSSSETMRKAPSTLSNNALLMSLLTTDVENTSPRSSSADTTGAATKGAVSDDNIEVLRALLEQDL